MTASRLSWLDHSEYDRRRAVEVIKLFEEKGTVDELGVGTVRDAISDLLFPGTSVLHPRARYFLIVPWVYRHLESRRTPSAEMEGKGRQLEVSLIDLIMDSDDNQGAIGRVARRDLKILPSTMFWSGLETWGIRLMPGTQTQYRRSLDRLYQEASMPTVRNDDHEVTVPVRRAWHPSLPKAPEGFGKEPLSLSLTSEEAAYLHERIMTRCGGSLLAHLVDRCAPSGGGMPWHHPQLGSFSTRHRSQLEHARHFSLAMHGAAILYNLMLAEKADGQAGRIDEYRASLAKWLGEIHGARDELRSWDTGAFWTLVLGTGARIPGPTRAFVDTWLSLVRGSAPAEAVAATPARRLISEREARLKGKLARLHNSAALKQWRGSSGLGRMSFRWNPQVRQIVADIQKGLGRHAQPR